MFLLPNSRISHAIPTNLIYAKNKWFVGTVELETAEAEEVSMDWELKSLNRFIQPVIDYVRIIRLKNEIKLFVLKLQKLK